MMPVGLKHSAQVMGYVPMEFKERILRLNEADRWLTMSRQLYEAMAEYLPKKERELKINPNPSKPLRSTPKS
jgi:hypothetical protein